LVWFDDGMTIASSLVFGLEPDLASFDFRHRSVSSMASTELGQLEVAEKIGRTTCRSQPNSPA